jgi:hypothetical protein
MFRGFATGRPSIEGVISRLSQLEYRLQQTTLDLELDDLFNLRAAAGGRCEMRKPSSPVLSV